MAALEFEPVIGLEVHAQLKTKSKAFTDTGYHFNSLPNTQVSPFCIAHPGTLPTINKNLIYFAIRLGLATHCRIARRFHFDRKNYFYPDLPKGYQISQDKEPICKDGYIDIKTDSGNKRIHIERIHMEEDAGKSMHDHDEYDSLIDLNRAGASLLEIVSKPDIHSSKEAYHYLVYIKQLLQYLDICEANMEKGNFRCDINVSVRLCGTFKMGTRTEIKNLNSFHNIEQAIGYEVKRQSQLILKGEKIVQETRQWNVEHGKTYTLRTKENTSDYRYFPEPDLPEVHIKEEIIDQIRLELPEFPEQRKKRFMAEYGINDYVSSILIKDRDIANFFEKVVNFGVSAVEASNCLMKFVMRELNTQKIAIHRFSIDAKRLAKLISLQERGVISSSAMGKIFEAMLGSKKSPDELMQELKLKQVSSKDIIEQYVQDVIKAFPDEVKLYKSGKITVIGFLIGKVMKASESQANPKIVKQCMEKYLR